MNSETEEVLLTGQGLEELCSFSKFKCLEALWLNDNKLRKVEGLDTNVQIKALYLHNNQLTTLKGSIKCLRHIRTLTLYNNRLQDLSTTLPMMEHLHHLDTLDMSGNPIANEFNYRLRVIHTFPTLQVLDRHQVTGEEREHAKKIFEGSRASSLAFMKRKPIWQNPPPQPIASLSSLGKEMYREISLTRKLKEEEERTREQSAFQTALLQPTQTVPVATAVEQVTMNSKTLADVLKSSDFELQMLSSAGGVSFAEETWSSETKPRVKGPERDVFKMKSFVEAHEGKKGDGTSKSTQGSLSRSGTQVSRSMSMTSSMLQQSGPGMITINTEKYSEYERKRRLGKAKTALKDSETWL